MPPELRSLELMPILNESSDGVALVARGSWQIVFANPALVNWLNTAEDELSAKSLTALIDSRGRFLITTRELDRASRYIDVDATERCQTGVRYFGDSRVEIQCVPIVIRGNAFVGVVIKQIGRACDDVEHFESQNGPCKVATQST